MDLSTSLMYVKGVGPSRAAKLAQRGLVTVEDLLAYPPFRYEDRTNVKTVRELAPGEMATVLVSVDSLRVQTMRRREVSIFEVFFTDSSQKILRGKWFHGNYLANVFYPGQIVALFGKVEWDDFSGDLQMVHPEYEIIEEGDSDAHLHMGRVVPIYEAVGKITTRMFRGFVARVLEGLPPQPDPLPPHIRERHNLPDYWTATRNLHFPPAGTDLRLLNQFRSPAQSRLILEEFFWLECGLAIKRKSAKRLAGISFELNAAARQKIKEMLPFKPTAAQKRVLAEIAQDMASPTPMNRLLQGDVGSGKTLVAAEAAVIAIENGYQAAILAPTEILAGQHLNSFRRLFDKLGYVTVLLTGSTHPREKTKLKQMIADGLVHVAAGTHALIEEDVEFHRLGLAIVDEQHRFGVMQRLRLYQKGNRPDVLVMTATPIPRTLALTIYGDLDTSVIDELPPGRQPVVTRQVTADRIELVWSFLRQQVDAGRQAYIVYPAVEESETQARKAATKMHEHLSQHVYPDLRLGLLHGRMKPPEKEDVMRRFQEGEIKILVSTTVVEVGVDVPNAAVIVIEQAERFGLAQLHQLRGRVGRGIHRSYCVLVTEKMNDAARERIRAVTESNDGFYLAEMDLRLRGPGEFFGTKQSGLPQLRMASLVRDQDLLEKARAEAIALVANPPTPGELVRAVDYLKQHWQRRYGLALVG